MRHLVGHVGQIVDEVDVPLSAADSHLDKWSYGHGREGGAEASIYASFGGLLPASIVRSATTATIAAHVASRVPADADAIVSQLLSLSLHHFQLQKRRADWDHDRGIKAEEVGELNQVR